MGTCKFSKIRTNRRSSYTRRDSGLFIIDDNNRKRNVKRFSLVTKTLDECDDEAEPRTEKISAFIKRSLLANPTFSQEMVLRHLTVEDMNKFVDATQIMHFQPGERLFQKYDAPCEHLYVVRRGIFRGLDGQTTSVILREGDVMGEIGYFQDCGQIITVVAEGDEASAYCLNKRDFKLIAEKGRDLNNIKILNGLSKEQKYMLKDTMGVANYARGDTILAEGALVNQFCIILSGSVRVINTTYNPNSYYYEDFCMYPGSYFGEESFILKYPRSTRTFIALKDVTVCVIDSVLFNSEEILKPVVDQLVIDVARRLKENKIRDAQGDEECNSVFTKGSRPTGRKIRKAKKVLWKGPDSDDEEGSIVRMRAPSQSTKLPVCACGLFPTY